MSTRTVLFTLILGVGVSPGSTPNAAAPGVDAPAAFEKLKTLAGEWEATTAEMGTVRVTYEVVAGGSAVLERESGEKMPPMITLYHLDGSRLLLTHYCMAGNQPRMEANAFDAESGELRFELVDVTNLPSPAAGHMRAVAIRFVDANHMTAAWQFHENGRLKFSETARYTRIR